MSIFKTKTFRFDIGETSLHEYISKLESRVPVWRSGKELPQKPGFYLVVVQYPQGNEAKVADWTDLGTWNWDGWGPGPSDIWFWTEIPRPTPSRRKMSDKDEDIWQAFERVLKENPLEFDSREVMEQNLVTYLSDRGKFRDEIRSRYADPHALWQLVEILAGWFLDANLELAKLRGDL